MVVDYDANTLRLAKASYDSSGSNIITIETP